MDVDVRTRPDPLEAPDADPPKPPTQLNRLRDRVEKARKERILELEIPGVGIVGKYSPLPETQRRKIENTHRGVPENEQNLAIAAAMLAWCCEGLYDKTPEGLVSLQGFESPPTWADPQLWEELGVSSAPNAVRAPYYAEGDIIGAAQELMMFSGYVGPKLLEAVRGN